MPQQFTNQGKAALTGSIGAGATALAVTGGLADLFPVANTTNWVTPVNWFKALITDNAGNIEVIKVGVRAAGSGAFSNILRAQDGTTAKAFTAGAAWVVHGPLAADFQAVLAGLFPTVEASGNFKQAGVVVRPVPIGGIIMWSGAVAAVPSGWGLCDGTNGTPDLRDKFIIGAGTDLAGASQTNVTGAQSKSGGAKDLVTPAHTHTASFAGSALAAHGHAVSDPTHVHSLAGAAPNTVSDITGLAGSQGVPGVAVNSQGGVGGYIGAAATGVTVVANSAGTPAGAVTVNSAGTSAVNANLPPYFALAFIQCLSTP